MGALVSRNTAFEELLAGFKYQKFLIAFGINFLLEN